MGYKNALVLVGDGCKGLPDRQPFDAIVVAAAAPRIQERLFQQLREGGCMVIPVGLPQSQELQLIAKQDGAAVVATLGGCSFVPLIGEKDQFPD